METINHPLYYFRKPRRIRKVLFLSKENKKKLEFCKKILDKNIKPERPFLVDESKIDLGPYTVDEILLDLDDSGHGKNSEDNIMRKIRTHLMSQVVVVLENILNLKIQNYIYINKYILFIYILYQ